MLLYHKYHDCGKPYCLKVNADKIQHFPNHAKISSKIFNNNICTNEIVSFLIEHDMDIHLFNQDQMKLVHTRDYVSMTNSYIIASLYLTSISEVLANAEMFGGYNSDSFKIKMKKLVRNGNHICEVYCGID